MPGWDATDVQLAGFLRVSDVNMDLSVKAIYWSVVAEKRSYLLFNPFKFILRAAAIIRHKCALKRNFSDYKQTDLGKNRQNGSSRA